MKFTGAIFALLATALAAVAQNAPTSPLRAPGAEPARAEPLRPPPIGAAPIAVAAPVTPAAAPKPAVLPAPAVDLSIAPSWDTQKLARNFIFTIPAPRGQIVDRNGVPLAQSRMAYNLAIAFPTPPQFSDADAMRYIYEQAALASELMRREIAVERDKSEQDKALKHYKNRGIMPLVIAQDLKPAEVAAIERANKPGLHLEPVYQRVYPQGALAGHIIGYVGRAGGYPTGVVENNEPLFPASEGREGLEKSFNEQLTGKPGVMHVSFDAQGRKSAKKITQPPMPGQTVVTTLDVNIQQITERSVAATQRPGAMVVMNPNTGEILAMASLPGFDPNLFVPWINEAEFATLRDDPGAPLVPRAYDSAYPPGSVFKIITGLAAMNEGFVDPEDEFEGSPTMEIGGRTFHNHTRKHQGMLSFVPALTVSCNPYYYRSGLKTGADPILDYAARLGFGRKTGIQLSGEDDGNLPTQTYMMRVHKRRYMPGDIANLSIGQGDLLVTPLQMAHAMACIGNGGTVYQPRLVSHVQGVDQKISLGFELRVRDQIDINKDVMKAIRDGMIGVVHGRGGTATSSAVPGFKIAAKTGTAQWGAGKTEKVAAWFAGFAPAERPQYAFAALYEGKEGSDAAHGGSHAAPVVQRVLKQILKAEPKETKAGGLRKKRRVVEEDDEEMDDENPPPRARVVNPADDDVQ